MNISDVANRSGLPAKTIRYYEDIGLIKPLRDGNGYRLTGQKLYISAAHVADRTAGIEAIRSMSFHRFGVLLRANLFASTIWLVSCCVWMTNSSSLASHS